MFKHTFLVALFLLVTITPCSAQTSWPIYPLWNGITGSNGTPFPRGVVVTHATGTNTPKAVWQNRDKTLPTSTGLTQFTLDSQGRFRAYGNGIYKIKVFAPSDTSLTSPIYEIDGIQSGESRVPWVDVTLYGAVGDGVTDDTVAIQAACDDAQGTVYLPEGKYKITGTINIGRNILMGVGVYDRTDFSVGTFLFITDTIDEAINIKSGGGLRGCNFFYPDQVTTETPIVYPPTVRINTTKTNPGIHISVRENTFVNSYIAIETTGESQNSTYLKIENNNFCSINTAIKHPFTLTETFIRNNSFSYSHWYASIGKAIRSTISSSAFCLELGDTAGTLYTGNISFGIGGIKLSSLTKTSITSISNNFFDGSHTALKIEDGHIIGECVINGNQFLAKDPNEPYSTTSRAIFISTKKPISGFLNITGNIFGSADGDHIYVDLGSTASFLRLNIAGNTFLSAGRNNTTKALYSVYLNGIYSITANVNSNFFEDFVNQSDGKSVGIFANCKDITINNNILKHNNIGIDISRLKRGSQAVVSSNIMRSINSKTILYPLIRNVIISDNILDDTFPTYYLLSSDGRLTLPETENKLITITGEKTIKSISPSWSGRNITLTTDASLKVIDGKNLSLNGDFSATLQDTITLISDGSSWNEVSRSVN